MTRMEAVASARSAVAGVATSVRRRDVGLAERHADAGVALLFFASGATGLVYEIVWFKRFTVQWGSSSLAMAAITSSFLLGLGLGAWSAGRLVARLRSPLAAYGLLEVFIGVWAWLVWPLQATLGTAIVQALDPGTSAPPLSALVRGLAALVCIGPACAAMGATLPILVAGLGPASVRTPRLYGVNTVGAAVGAGAAGFWLLPALGLHGATAVVAAANLAIGIAAIALARRLPLAGAFPPPALRDDGRARASSAQLLSLGAAVALSGMAALLLQVVWTRQLVLVLGGSTYAFSAVLCALLVGVGAGSLACDRFPLRWRADGRALVILLSAGCVTVATTQLMVPDLARLAGYLREMRASTLANAAVSVGSGAVLMLLPSMVLGACFPCFVAFASAQSGDGGRAVGVTYAWNTLGAIVGIWMATLLLVPSIGVSRSAAVAVLALTAAALVVHHLRPAPGGVSALAIALTGAAAAAWISPGHDPRVVAAGHYIYGAVTSEAMGRTVFHADGASSTVTVSAIGDRLALRVNGKVDASNGGDMPMQLGLAYFPAMLRPDARDVLIVGMGSGCTAGGSLLVPGTRTVVCEIEPAVVEAARLFADVNHRALDHADLEVVLDDARSYLRGTQRRFDLVLSEPSNPWLAGVTGLFTEEFYSLVRERLADGGLFAQWIQLYAMDAEDYVAVVRTIRRAFPHAALMRISEGDTILLASAAEVLGDRSALERARAHVAVVPTLREDLQRWFGVEDPCGLLLRHLVLDDEGVARLIGPARPGAPTIRDANLRLEFTSPRRVFRRPAADDAPGARVLAAYRAKTTLDAWDRWGAGAESVAALDGLCRVLEKNGRADAALELALGASLRSDATCFLARCLAREREAGAAPGDEWFDDIARLAGEDPAEANRLGLRLYAAGDDLAAEAVFAALIERYPLSASAHARRARARERLGDSAGAATDYARARARSRERAHPARAALGRERSGRATGLTPASTIVSPGGRRRGSAEGSPRR